ncbi:DEAD/DEAH box helicase [Lewinella sp. IMCC34191]|uniref:DEAD/DEAH box helicase n=1 Tax=Lewinella sp. IMCC34191 TaxID=2259172 RepID=UPI000E23955B|nr:DEAD/DEAH box helicase [Lewinella sp. IMCC34191]
MQLPSLTEDQAACLDAVLVSEDHVPVARLADLLNAEGIKESTGRDFTPDLVSIHLKSLVPGLLSVYGYVTCPPARREELLAWRGTADNPYLPRLAARVYRQEADTTGRNFSLRASYPTVGGLALLANDFPAFQAAWEFANRRVWYGSRDFLLLDSLLRITEPAFWNWRDTGFRRAILERGGREPFDLDESGQQLIVDLLRRDDLLGYDNFRLAERAGLFALPTILKDELVRDAHLDLDLLCRLVSGEQIDSELLHARLTAAEGEPDFIDVPLFMAAYRSGAASAAEIEEVLHGYSQATAPNAIEALWCWLDERQGRSPEENELALVIEQGPEVTCLDTLALLWVAHWTGLRLPDEFREATIGELDRLTRLPWVYGETLHALAALYPLHPQRADWQRKADALAERYGFTYLLGLQPGRPRWESALRQVEQLTSGKRNTRPTYQDLPAYRTVWIVDDNQRDIYPKEQKLGAKGYSKGRKLKWSELFGAQHRRHRKPEDLNAVFGLLYADGRPVRSDYYIQEELIVVLFERMLYELAGHPHLYLGESKRLPLTVERGEPAVTVADQGETLRLRFDPPVESPGRYQLKRTTPTRWVAYALSERQAALGRAVGYGLDVPASARERLEATVEGMRDDVSVQSDTDLLRSDLPVVEGAPRLSVHLVPLGDGYQVQLLVRPLAGLPLYFPPGEGMQRSLVAVDEGRRILQRDLEAEAREARELIESCPALGTPRAGHYEWQLDDEEATLAFLLELRVPVSAGQVEVEYPRGQPLRLDKVADFEDMKLRVGKKREWFEVSGEVILDEHRVLDLQLLFEQLRNDKSRFVKLQAGEFIALTDELRERMEQLEGMLHDRGKSLQLPALAAEPFADLVEDFGEVTNDDAWREALARIESARYLRPAAPKNFLAELRPYQREGYDWLCRLAEWGVGACLADDMGLGKTIQALAILTQRAKLGPALVLAPASVVRNWRSECERFAPALRPLLLAKRSDVHLIDELGPGDLLLVSYGLLTYVADELGAIDYATIVLDEAQAIKNPTTKRSRTVRDLRADFRIATTGTPIENHLGELWSLFRFLNPGLLGSRKAFNEHYGVPIAGGNSMLGDQLRRLVQPFILRRRKDEVLKELPAKTEVVLSVSPRAEEAALYEALRRDALQEINEAPPEKKKFIVLRQLTRLRQAACHPRLVRPESALPSAKLELVGETIRELLDNGHKALVFSQFVQHLKIVEEWVKAAGIPYQYLDGSTPGKERARRVDAFQAGEGELFLISLKAGGTGLNLTAADYVLHLDPWWNPAAEDQASDRAHRIGQQRPVTVYRFVTEGTIEERVLALHDDKRDLADRMLAGTGKSAGLDVDEVLRMLAG